MKIDVFDYPMHCRLTLPLQRTPANIAQALPETRVNGLHFCRWKYGSIFIHFCGGLRKTHLFSSRMRFGRSRSSKVVDFGTNRKGVCHFLLVINSNLVLSYTVSEIRRVIGWKLRIFPTPPSFVQGEPVRISVWNAQKLQG